MAYPIIDKLFGGILNRGQSNMGGQLNMGNPYGQMLTPQQQRYANRQGLMAGAARGLQMSGPSRMPISTGQIMGGMLGAALPARQQAQQTAVQGRLAGFQFKDLERKEAAQNTQANARLTLRGMGINDGVAAMTSDDPQVQALGPTAFPSFFQPRTVAPGSQTMVGQRVIGQAPFAPTKPSAVAERFALAEEAFPDDTPQQRFDRVIPPKSDSSFQEKMDAATLAFPGDTDAERFERVAQMSGTNLTVNNGSVTSPQYGNAPTDMMWILEDDGKHVMTDVGGGRQGPLAVPVPGSTLDQSRRETARRETETRSASVEQARVVSVDIDRAIERITANPNLTTGFAAITSAVYGTPAHGLKTLLETVEANVSFKALSDMKKASTSGGALGAINTRELELLAATWGSLRQSNTAEDLIFNLRRIQKQSLDIIHGKGLWMMNADGTIKNDATQGIKPSDIREPNRDPRGVPEKTVVREKATGRQWMSISGQWIRTK